MQIELLFYRSFENRIENILSGWKIKIYPLLLLGKNGGYTDGKSIVYGHSEGWR